MGKKRRVWWVVGALAVAAALFAAVAFFVVYNNTDARMERAVAQIVEEYGFAFTGQARGNASKGDVTMSYYVRAPTGEETADEIVAILRDSCPEYKRTVIGTDDLPDWYGGEIKSHGFQPADQDLAYIAVVTFNPNDRGAGDPDAEPAASLVVFRYDYRPSEWQRIKGLWPW